MWVFLNNAFVSAVVDRRRPSRLLVRARHAGDLERFIPGCVVEVTPRADYRYRTSVKRSTFRKALERAEAAIDYDNFKSSVQDRRRHDAYLGCWGVMHRWQEDVATSPLSLDTRALLSLAQLNGDDIEDAPDAEADLLEDVDEWIQLEDRGLGAAQDAAAEERERAAYMDRVLAPDAEDRTADARRQEKARVEDLFAEGMREAARPEVEAFEAYLRGEDPAAPDPRTRTQIDLFTQAPDPRARYAGRTFAAALDQARLDTAQAIVLRALLAERWMSLPELRALAGSAADSRVRDLRKPEFGGFSVQARRAAEFSPQREDPDDFTAHAREAVHQAYTTGGRRAGGVWLYRITPDSVTPAMVEAAARKLGLDAGALPTPRRARAARMSAR